MNLSDKKKTEAYSAISDPITNLRLLIERGQLTIEEMDEELFLLEQVIWKNVKQSLNIKE